MNIEEARRVLWVKSNHRPLGELLDEGYLTKERLEWAAQWAYNAKLQQAAKVILDSINYPTPVAEVEGKPETLVINVKDSAIETGISYDKACSTIWPFSPYKGQSMGTLVESKQLSLKDLGYAVENAWDERVRQAATTFSLIRLNQVVQEPVPSAGFVRVVSGGRSYSEREQLRLALIEGMVLGWSAVILAALIWWLFSGALRPKPNTVSINEIEASPIQLITVIVVLVIVILGGWAVASIPDRITKRLEKRIEEHHRGQEGEDNVVQLIVQALDGNWQLFRNICLPGRNKGDLDLVLVGPPGVWVLEVKNYSGKYRNVGENWEYRRGNNWKTVRKNPSRQALNNAYRLKNFLKADRVNAFVNSAIVWANQESPLSVENPSVTIWRYNRLADELGNIWQGEKLSETERNKIVVKLTKLCEQQKKAH